MNLFRKMFKKDTTTATTGNPEGDTTTTTTTTVTTATIITTTSTKNPEEQEPAKDQQKILMAKEEGGDTLKHMQDDKHMATMKKKDDTESHEQQQPMNLTGSAEQARTDRKKIRKLLNHHLADLKAKQRRKSESDLALVLRGPAHDLQMAQTKDHLSQLMRKREDRHSLVEQGILLDERCIAGPIQSNAKELERHMLCDKLEYELRERHPKEELEKMGVIKEGMDSLQGIRCSLEQEQKKIQLKRKLSDRPTPEQLQKQHILPMDDVNNTKNGPAVMTTEEQKIKKKKTKKNKKN